MALGALGVFRAHGLVCPRDVSLVGYNNSPTIDQVDPPLTSVAYPGTEVGQAAGSLALQLIVADRPTDSGRRCSSRRSWRGRRRRRPAPVLCQHASPYAADLLT